MTRAPEVHLLFGMARSGTTFLARALERIDGVAVFGESDFFGRSYQQPGADGRYDARALAGVVTAQVRKEWTETTGDRGRPLERLAPGRYAELVCAAIQRLEAPTPAETFGAIAEAVAEHSGCATVIEKTPGHLLFVERVAEALPQARCIASWREPAGFVRSFLMLDARDPRAAMRLLGRVSRHTALGVLMWRSYMRALERARELLGPRLLVLSHAQLREDPHAVLDAAAAHFGLDASGVALDDLPRNSSAEPGALPPADLRLWLGLLARDLEASEVARAELPATSFPRAVRSLSTVAPASLMFAARVLPSAQTPLSYVRGYLGRSS